MKSLLHMSLLRRSEFLSPRDLVQRAIVIAIAFSIVHLAGLRDFTSVLNGTIGSTRLNWTASAFLGLIYVTAYLGVVLLVPILLLAASVLTLQQRRALRLKDRHESKPS